MHTQKIPWFSMSSFSNNRYWKASNMIQLPRLLGRQLGWQYSNRFTFTVRPLLAPQRSYAVFQDLWLLYVHSLFPHYGKESMLGSHVPLKKQKAKMFR